MVDFVKENSYYDLQMKHVPAWIAELGVILEDVDAWVNSKGLDVRDFKYLCNNFKSKKELVRIHVGLTNIESTAKVEKLLKITSKEVDGLLDVINAVLKLVRNSK